MICIPRVSCHIKKRDIYKVLEQINLGVINDIELRYNATNRTNLCIIHISSYNKNMKALRIKNELEKGGNFTIVYKRDTIPILWKCYKYTSDYIKPNM